MECNLEQKNSLIKCFREYPNLNELKKIKQTFNYRQQAENFLIIVRFLKFAILKDENLKDLFSKVLNEEKILGLQENIYSYYSTNSEWSKSLYEEKIQEIISQISNEINQIETLFLVISTESHLKNVNETDY